MSDAALEVPQDLDPLFVKSDRATADESDVANAERFVELHENDVRYVGAWGKWLTWDGRRWVVDDHSAALALAIDTSRAMLAEAAQLLESATLAFEAVRTRDVKDEERVAAEDARERAKSAYAWAARSQSSHALEAMLHVASAHKSVSIRYEQLDTDIWLLNAENGTLDLRTGHLREHRREDLITKVTPIVFDPDAKCPRWEAFLDHAMASDGGLVSYLQRFAGYVATGETREHALAFHYGDGANGKSTFTGTLHDVLGDYAMPASRGLLFRSAKTDRHPTELASLRGRRLVTCSEIGAGQSFDEALVKDLTGGDPINCRRMREDEWTFQPTHKLFLAGNHKPVVRGDDEGIWRRIRLVPWTVIVPEAQRDRDLRTKLRAELPGILAWIVRGCLEWQRSGLGEPLAVVEATAEYRSSEDALGQFFASCITFDANARITARDLRERYEAWCRDLGYENPVGPRVLAERLRARGVTRTTQRTEQGVRDAWRGVREATQAELAARALATASHYVTTDRRDVVGCSDTTLSYQPSARTRDARAIGANPESSTTSPYATTPPTSEDEPFAEWVNRQVGGQP